MVAIIKPGIILFSLIVLYLLYNNKAKVVKNIENPKDLAPPMIMKREVPKVLRINIVVSTAISLM